jgi:cation diffusion facilitator family transporter
MSQPGTRDRNVQRIIVIEGSANCVVLGLKLWVGLTTGSLAILGDALHSLTDVLNNVVAWIVIRISAKPPDREHPYGHRKFEGLAVFLLATLLVVLAFELAVQGLRREPVVPAMHPSALILMFSVLGINIGLSAWQRYWARRLGSDILLADANHTFADVLTTIVVIAGWQLSARGFPWLDTACALAVSILVMYLAYGLFRRVAPVLVDRIAIAPEEVTATILSIPEVLEVRRVRTRWIGQARSADVVVAVRNSLSLEESHRIADKIEAALEADFGIEDLTIHVEPQTGPKSPRAGSAPKAATRPYS